MKRIAAFLDRDGVINKENGLIHKVEQFELLPEVDKNIKRLNDAGILVIVVTNQAVVARGYLCDEQFVIDLHKNMVAELKEKGAIIDDIFYCPHHPNADDPRYRKDCNFRKPNTGMIDKAVKKYGIDIKKSFVVGDMTGDIQLGKNAGCKTILVTEGYGGSDKKHDVKPDFVVKDLPEAVDLILKEIKK